MPLAGVQDNRVRNGGDICAAIIKFAFAEKAESADK